MLKNIPLFSGLGEAELAELGRHAVVRNYPKNTVIINEGDHSDSLYLIQDGRVKIYLADEQGKEIVIYHQGPGEYFGELALLDDAARSASVMTLERSSFCVLSKDVFRDFLAHNPNVAVSLIKDLTHRVRAITDNVKSLALLDVYGRVAKTLLGMATPQGDRLVIESKLTQQDIAARVGASREMVSRILKDLATGGNIHMEQKHIVIHDRLPARYCAARPSRPAEASAHYIIYFGVRHPAPSSLIAILCGVHFDCCDTEDMPELFKRTSR